jgi:hypothetical protein
MYPIESMEVEEAYDVFSKVRKEAFWGFLTVPLRTGVRLVLRGQKTSMVFSR